MSTERTPGAVPALFLHYFPLHSNKECPFGPVLRQKSKAERTEDQFIFPKNSTINIVSIVLLSSKQCNLYYCIQLHLQSLTSHIAALWER